MGTLQWSHNNSKILGYRTLRKKKKPAKPWSISSFPDLKDKTDVSMLSSLESDSSRDLCLANFLTEALLSSPSSGPELAWPPLSTGLTGVDVSRPSLLSSDSRSRMRLADLLLVDRALLSSTWSMTSLLSSSLAKKKVKRFFILVCNNYHENLCNVVATQHPLSLSSM